ncbi:GDNF/GAS1 [Trinorchestia longiramus]|nr:GDNF/GAS1 [Trinorchestia longiramus]
MAGREKATTASVETKQELCHHSLTACQHDSECAPLLEKVMMWCEHSHCEPDRCRGALQNFYSSVHIQRRLEVAFCVCRKSDNDGQCLTAMRKLHPSCAERHTSSDPQQCQEIARLCRASDSCRHKLETYERDCAVDAITGRCAGTLRDCQHAVIKILGTELHASCVCKGTDFLQQQQDCDSWHKLLWSNPCVSKCCILSLCVSTCCILSLCVSKCCILSPCVSKCCILSPCVSKCCILSPCVIESHLELREEIRSGAHLDEVFTRAPQTTSTPYSTSTSTMASEIDGGYVDGYMYHGGADPMAGDLYGRGRGGAAAGVGVGPGLMGGRGRGQSLDFSQNGRHAGAGGVGAGVGGGGFRHAPAQNFGRSGSGGIIVGPEKPVGGLGPSRQSKWGRRQTGIPRPGVDMGGDRRRPSLPLGATDISPNSALVPSYDRLNGEGTDSVLGASTNSNTSDSSAVESCFIKEEVEGKAVGSWEIPIDTSRRLMRKGGCSDMCHCKRTAGEARPSMQCFTLSCIKHRGKDYPCISLVKLVLTSIKLVLSVIKLVLSIIKLVLPVIKLMLPTIKLVLSVIKLVLPSIKLVLPSIKLVLLSIKLVLPSIKLVLPSIKLVLPMYHRLGCNTTTAVYPHKAPYIQAFRGQCVCYSGKFICQRPAPDQFKPGLGVYLFLGYSHDEMEIMKPYTRMSEDEAIKEIGKLLKRKYGFKCKLVLQEKIDQNLILMPELEDEEDEEYSDPYHKHRRELDECTKPLEELAHWINQNPRDNDLHTEAYLSMFILAEVHVNISEAHASGLSFTVRLAAMSGAITTAIASVPVSAGLYWSWAVSHAETANII